MYGLHFGVFFVTAMSGGCERPVVVAVDGQRCHVSLVGLNALHEKGKGEESPNLTKLQMDLAVEHLLSR